MSFSEPAHSSDIEFVEHLLDLSIVLGAGDTAMNMRNTGRVLV